MGITALITTLARTEEQAGGWNAIVAVTLGILGGAFFSLVPGARAPQPAQLPHAARLVPRGGSTSWRPRAPRSRTWRHPARGAADDRGPHRRHRPSPRTAGSWRAHESLEAASTIARANLVRLLRDRLGLFFIVVLPLIIILVTGLQFGGGFEARVGVAAVDGGALADELIATLERDYQVERYTDVGDPGD